MLSLSTFQLIFEEPNAFWAKRWVKTHAKAITKNWSPSFRKPHPDLTFAGKNCFLTREGKRKKQIKKIEKERVK